MDSLENVLSEYNNTITCWRETPFDDLFKSAELMKDLAIILNNLSLHKIEYQIHWNKKCFELRDKMSVAASEKTANNELPELGKLRQVLKAGNNVLDSIRSQVSLLKQEQNN